MLVLLAIPAWAAVGDALDAFEQGPLFTARRWVEVRYVAPVPTYDVDPLVDVHRYEVARDEPWPGQVQLDVAVDANGRVRGASMRMLAAFRDDPASAPVASAYLSDLLRTSAPGADVHVLDALRRGGSADIPGGIADVVVEGDFLRLDVHVDDRPAGGWDAVFPKDADLPGWTMTRTDDDPGDVANGWAPSRTVTWQRPDGAYVRETILREPTRPRAPESREDDGVITDHVGRYFVAVGLLRHAPSGRGLVPVPADGALREFDELAVDRCAAAR